MKANKNDIVAVTFLDHSEGDEAIEFTVCGRVMKQDKVSVLIGVWVHADPKRKVEVASNVHTYTIIKSTITRSAVLMPAGQMWGKGGKNLPS